MNTDFLKGAITALITPFTPEGEVDFAALEKLIDFQIEGGVDGILVLGSTGESATLTYKEKTAIIIKSVEYSAGRVPIIVGTGSNETESSAALTVFAREHGADAALIVAPYYNKPPQRGLYEHYKLIADKVDIPIVIYNVPGRTAINITAETQLKIAESCPNVVATKEASGDLEQMSEIIRNAPKDFTLLSGDDALSIPVIAIGGKGTVSVISNYAPKLFSQMINSALRNGYKKAREIHYKLFDLMKLNFVESNPIPVKCAMSLMELCEPVYRMPLVDIKEENKNLIRSALTDAGLIKKSKKKK